MSKPKIVIIDSGVQTTHPKLTNDKLHQIIIGENNIVDNNQNAVHGHGTAIYGIIRKMKFIGDVFVEKASIIVSAFYFK